jgi:hypothetical protein
MNSITQEETQLFFHHLISFNYDKFTENPEITNDVLMNINNNLIRIDESK